MITTLNKTTWGDSLCPPNGKSCLDSCAKQTEESPLAVRGEPCAPFHLSYDKLICLGKESAVRCLWPLLPVTNLVKNFSMKRLRDEQAQISVKRRKKKPQHPKTIEVVVKCYVFYNI